MAIVVRDLDRALALYRDGLGLRLDRVEDLPDRGIRVAFLEVGDTHIELIQPMREDSEVSDFLARRGEGVHHLAFGSRDLDRSLQSCQAVGARVVTGDRGVGAGGTRVVFLHPKSTGGVLMELVGPPGTTGADPKTR